MQKSVTFFLPSISSVDVKKKKKKKKCLYLPFCFKISCYIKKAGDPASSVELFKRSPLKFI